MQSNTVFAKVRVATLATLAADLESGINAGLDAGRSLLDVKYIEGRDETRDTARFFLLTFGWSGAAYPGKCVVKKITSIADVDVELQDIADTHELRAAGLEVQSTQVMDIRSQYNDLTSIAIVTFGPSASALASRANPARQSFLGVPTVEEGSSPTTADWECDVAVPYAAIAGQALDLTGVAGIGTNRDLLAGVYALAAPLRASLSTGGVTYSARVLGVDGNDISIELVESSDINAPLVIEVSSDLVVSIQLETEAGVIVTTAQDIEDALTDVSHASYNLVAARLITAEATSPSDVQVATAETSLAGGADIDSTPTALTNGNDVYVALVLTTETSTPVVYAVHGTIAPTGTAERPTDIEVATALAQASVAWDGEALLIDYVLVEQAGGNVSLTGTTTGGVNSDAAVALRQTSAIINRQLLE